MEWWGVLAAVRILRFVASRLFVPFGRYALRWLVRAMKGNGWWETKSLDQAAVAGAVTCSLAGAFLVDGAGTASGG